MSTSQNALSEFEESLRDAATYPENLRRCNEFSFALEQYRNKLVNKDSKVFKEPPPSGSRPMVALDYAGENKPFILSEPMRDVEAVKKIMPGNVQEPKCRYVFIHSRYSRDPLTCSVEQMQYLLSHLQAMPAFVDYIMTFRLREEPHMEASMKVDDDLHDKGHTSFGAPGLSGQRMQHCFNLLGVEVDSKEPWPYLMRQTAAYFSFDVVNGQTSWIIIKANVIIRKRIAESSQSTGKHRRCLNKHLDAKSSFLTALSAHLLIFEWCLENRAEYTAFLENELQSPSSQQRLVQVSKLTSADKIAETFSKNQPLHSAIRSRNTGFSERSQISTRNSILGFKRTPSLSRGNTIPSQSHNSGLTTANLPVNPPSRGVDLEEMYSFEKLQKLHRLSDRIENTRTMISQDIDVLTEMLSRFEDVMNTDEFKHHIKLEAFEVRDFFRGTRWCLRELGCWQTRLQSMSSGLEQTISLFNATLQYKDMRTNAFFAQQAQISTDAMEKITVEMAEIALKTRQETNSMHIITIFTLIFLPGTFVATFFSSGVLDFDDYDGNLPMVESIGYNTKWAALKLFAVICLPLMGVTLSAWGLVYFWAWRQTRNPATSKEPDSKLEKGILQ